MLAIPAVFRMRSSAACPAAGRRGSSTRMGPDLVAFGGGQRAGAGGGEPVVFPTLCAATGDRFRHQE
jgi:hypothetical protein